MMSPDEYRDLRDRIDALSGRGDTRFGQVDRQLEQINRRFEQIDRRFVQVDQRFVQLETTLRAEIRASAAETRRYMDILYEKFHADVERVVDGYQHQSLVLDDHERRIHDLEQGHLRFDG